MSIGKRKLSVQEKRKIRIRNKIIGNLARPRMSAFKSSFHTYAQIIRDDTGTTLVSASTRDKDVLAELEQMRAANTTGAKVSTKSVLAAKAVGRVIGRKLLSSGASAVVFDRNGCLYTGRIKALADGARESGLDL